MQASPEGETAGIAHQHHNEVQTYTVKEGYVKKRTGRMHQWTSRYFILTNNNLSYKIKPESSSYRGNFDLSPECVVSDVIDENKMLKSNKLFSFWVVWPKVKGKSGDDKQDHDSDYDSDDGAVATAQQNTPIGAVPGSTSAATNITGSSGNRKDLQKIICNEVNTQKRQRSKAEEQVEVHASHDSSVSNGAIAGAVVVGGVVVGALTMGIGLLPYLAVVGVTAAASGGAVALNSRRRPANSRLIMAFDTNKEALEWKNAIEEQIRSLSGSRKPTLPDSVDAKAISDIIDLASTSAAAGGWRRVDVIEGVCILEYTTLYKSSQNYHPVLDFLDKSVWYVRLMTVLLDSAGQLFWKQQRQLLTSGKNPVDSNRIVCRSDTRCRKAQIAVSSTPASTFLTLMNTDQWCWPQRGSLKVVREIDDHADVIQVELVVTQCRLYGGSSQRLVRTMCLSRFWQLDDDGVYLITFSSLKDDQFPASLSGDHIHVAVDNNNSSSSSSSSNTTTTTGTGINTGTPNFTAVITVAPRHDVSHIDREIPECMVTCICQVTDSETSTSTTPSSTTSSSSTTTTTNINNHWQRGEVPALMEDFMKDNLLELRHRLSTGKFGVDSVLGGGAGVSADGGADYLSSSSAAMAMSMMGGAGGAGLLGSGGGAMYNSPIQTTASSNHATTTTATTAAVAGTPLLERKESFGGSGSAITPGYQSDSSSASAAAVGALAATNTGTPDGGRGSRGRDGRHKRSSSFTSAFTFTATAAGSSGKSANSSRAASPSPGAGSSSNSNNRGRHGAAPAPAPAPLHHKHHQHYQQTQESHQTPSPTKRHGIAASNHTTAASVTGSGSRGVTTVQPGLDDIPFEDQRPPHTSSSSTATTTTTNRRGGASALTLSVGAAAAAAAAAAASHSSSAPTTRDTNVADGIGASGYFSASDTTSAATTAAAPAPKKRMGFLQRMKSNNNIPVPPPPGSSSPNAAAAAVGGGGKGFWGGGGGGGVDSRDSSRAASPIRRLHSAPLNVADPTNTGNSNDMNSHQHHQNHQQPRGRGDSSDYGAEESDASLAAAAIGYPHGPHKHSSAGSSRARGESFGASSVSGGEGTSMGDEGASPTAPGSGGGGGKPASKHRRDKKTNAEANQLRNQIIMTEYEIQRGVKALRKKQTAQQAAEQQALASGADAFADQSLMELSEEISMLQTHQDGLKVKWQGLKDAYQIVTGEEFEHAKGTRGMVERWKSARTAHHREKERKKDIKAAAAASAAAAVSSRQLQQQHKQQKQLEQNIVAVEDGFHPENLRDINSEEEEEDEREGEFEDEKDHHTASAAAAAAVTTQPPAHWVPLDSLLDVYSERASAGSGSIRSSNAFYRGWLQLLAMTNGKSPPSSSAAAVGVGGCVYGSDATYAREQMEIADQKTANTILMTLIVLLLTLSSLAAESMS